MIKNLIKNIILQIESYKEINNKEKNYEYKKKNYLILENDFYYKKKQYYLLNIKSQNDENMEYIGLQFVYIFNEPNVITTVCQKYNLQYKNLVINDNDLIILSYEIQLNIDFIYSIKILNIKDDIKYDLIINDYINNNKLEINCLKNNKLKISIICYNQYFKYFENINIILDIGFVCSELRKELL